MKRIRALIWDCIGKADAIMIPTNGMVKRNGNAVMGAGLSKEADYIFPGLARALGAALMAHGKDNRPYILGEYQGTKVCSYPVVAGWEYYRGTNLKSSALRYMSKKGTAPGKGDWIPGWACRPRMSVIARSALAATVMANLEQWKEVALGPVYDVNSPTGPKTKTEVFTEMTHMLDDRFTVYEKPFGNYPGEDNAWGPTKWQAMGA